MSEETVPPAPDPIEEAPAATETATEEGPKKKKKRKVRKKKASAKKKRKKGPNFKDWIRVQKSTGNSLENKTVHAVINTATGILTLVTNAPKSEEEPDEMEGERQQIIKITSHEVVDIPASNDEA